MSGQALSDTAAGATPSTRKALRLYLIRHGETEWSLSGQHTGSTDIALTANGEEVARELGRALRGVSFTHAFSSSRQRARRTSELVDPGPAVQIDPDLAEWDYGEYEGLRSSEVRASRAGWNIYRDGCPNGESPEQVLARAQRLLARLAALEGNVALFSHGQFGAVLAARWIGLPVVEAEHFPLATASLAILGFAAHHPEVPVIEQWNGCAQSSSVLPSPVTCELQVPLKRLVVFDLDGTLAESKASIDGEMADLLGGLLQSVRVAIISGGAWAQFQKQVVSHLPPNANLNALSLLPTCGTKFYRYTGDWQLLYSEDFTAQERDKITAALNSMVESSHVATPGTWGELIEDRGSQITFSALGQTAPLDQKKKWDPDFAKRRRMQAFLAQQIPEFSVRLGGATSIDITKAGIDKAYGVRKLRDLLGISIAEMMFIGDAVFPGGNDYPAKEAGVVSVRVRDSEETKRLIETILVCSSGIAGSNAVARGR